jgi:N6-L-threonylcarbamoyladenine synthase
VKFAPSQIKHPDRKTAAASGEKNSYKKQSWSSGRPRPESHAAERPRFDFSYSGIKTAVLRYVETHALAASIAARSKALSEIAKPKLEDYLGHCDQQTLDLVASFQRAMVGDLVAKTLAAAREYEIATLFVTGGVAANNELRQTFEQEAARDGLPVYFPSRPLSTDNAAMIAAAAYPKFLAGSFATMDFSAEAAMALK